MKYNEEKMLKLGKLWEKYGKKRIYFDTVSLFFDAECYKSGNFKRVYWKGTNDAVSNSEASRVHSCSCYYDYLDDCIHTTLPESYNNDLLKMIK